jgi:spore germination protein GerM
MRGVRVRGLLVAVLVALLVGATGCGIPTDDEPQPLADDTVSTPPAEPAPEVGDNVATVYLVSDDQLVASTRALDGEETPERVLDVLLLPTTEEEQQDGLQTFVPQGTVALGVADAGDGIWSVDMSTEWETLVNPAALRAYGQVVLTLTALDGVEAVRFSIDGVSVDAVPTVAQEVTAVAEASDYEELVRGEGEERPSTTVPR